MTRFVLDVCLVSRIEWNPRSDHQARSPSEATTRIRWRLHLHLDDPIRLPDQGFREGHLRAALAQFTPVWKQLTTVEQARVVQLLVERIDYNGGTGNLGITFRPAGVKILAQENPS